MKAWPRRRHRSARVERRGGGAGASGPCSFPALCLPFQPWDSSKGGAGWRRVPLTVFGTRKNHVELANTVVDKVHLVVAHHQLHNVHFFAFARGTHIKFLICRVICRVCPVLSGPGEISSALRCFSALRCSSPPLSMDSARIPQIWMATCPDLEGLLGSTNSNSCYRLLETNQKVFSSSTRANSTRSGWVIAKARR